MKRIELLRQARQRADAVGVDHGQVRQGAEHEIWQFGSTRVVVPRHREISPCTALDIQRRLEVELGRDWWKR